MELDGRRVLVTGASRGIGETLARRFAGAGAAVALVARDEAAIGALAAELHGSAHPADLTDPGAVRCLLDRVEADAGPVDVVVNNAGIDLTEHIATLTADQLDTIFRLNLVTPAELCRQAVPRMLARGGGHLVNISSMAGVATFPGLAAYGSTKAGLTHFTAGLRADLRGMPVGTTVVELGPVPTEMLEHTGGYRPTRHAFRRFARIQLLPNTSRERVADEVVAAVERDRTHVRLPRRTAPFAMMTATPGRITEMLLTGIDHQSARAD